MVLRILLVYQDFRVRIPGVLPGYAIPILLICRNIGIVIMTFDFAAMKEAKALSVPSAKYNEADLPSAQLDYGAVSDQDIMTSSVNG